MCTRSDSAANQFLSNIMTVFETRCPFGKRIVALSKRAFHYFFWERNPLLQILYLTLICGGWLVGVFEVFPKLPNLYLADYHRYTFTLVFALTVGSFYVVCSTPPGYITKSNVRKYSKYPYDMMMYVPKRCRTTNILKPARSKYCNIMKANVARFDHYCGWVAQPVGEENYRYFLVFLFMTFSMLAYATVGIALTALSIVKEKGLLGATFINRHTGERFPATKMMVLNWIIANDNLMMAAGVMAFVMGIVVFAFFMYHLYLASQNLTTNESYKWSEFKESIAAAKEIMELRVLRERDATANGKDSADTSDLPVVPDRYKAIAAATNDLNDLHNVYDRGVWANLSEVFFPRSLRAPPIPSVRVSRSQGVKKRQ